jgi:hypothetical protein
MAGRAPKLFLPPRFQHPLGRVAYKLGRRLHEWRWQSSDDERRRQLAQRHLHLDQHYWLFVLGANNSGTTLLARLLESHRVIRSLPREGQRYTTAFPRPSDLGIGRMWGTKLDAFRWTEVHDGAPALRAMYDWSFCYDRRPGIILEKSPPHTVRGRWLQKHFQPCRFLATTRHPFAVCEGVRRRKGCSLEDAAAHWTAVNATLLEDEPHLSPYLRISYEALCEQQEPTLRKIEQFLGLSEPFDRSVLTRRYDVHNVQDVPVQGLQNFNQQSVDRLSPAERDAIVAIAGDVMQRLGYATSTVSAQNPGT